MDIVFEHNPRKRIPRETMDKWMSERGMTQDEKDAQSFKEKSEA